MQTLWPWQRKPIRVQPSPSAAVMTLAARYGRFPLVISLDVIEHCFDPLAFCAHLHLSDRARRRRDALDALSRLPEKSGARGERTYGPAFYGTTCRRPH